MLVRCNHVSVLHRSFFGDSPAYSGTSTPSLHDALPICAVVLASGDLVESIPSLVGPQFVSDDVDPLQLWFQQLPDSGIRAEKAVAEFERQLVEAALERNHHIKARAGRWLGFGDRAKDKMRYLCDKYDIEVQEGL